MLEQLYTIYGLLPAYFVNVWEEPNTVSGIPILNIVENPSVALHAQALAAAFGLTSDTVPVNRFLIRATPGNCRVRQNHEWELKQNPKFGSQTETSWAVIGSPGHSNRRVTLL